jgi:hypothetical protein
VVIVEEVPVERWFWLAERWQSNTKDDKVGLHRNVRSIIHTMRVTTFGPNGLSRGCEVPDQNKVQQQVNSGCARGKSPQESAAIAMVLPSCRPFG